MDEFEKGFYEDLEQMLANRVPTSWEMDGDKEALALVHETLAWPNTTNVGEAFRALAFNSWDESEVLSLTDFIDVCLAWALDVLKGRTYNIRHQNN